MREAAAGVFLWPAWGLYDTVKGHVADYNDSFHGCDLSTSGTLSGRIAQMFKRYNQEYSTRHLKRRAQEAFRALAVRENAKSRFRLALKRPF
jgi:hypothetical protein